jgi:hypothetical protein
MSKFRKRPAVIDAIRWDGRGETLLQMRDEWGYAFVMALDGLIAGEMADDECKLRLETLEGTMLVSEGDWVIRGLAGEFYPRKPDIFVATYEPVESPSE